MYSDYLDLIYLFYLYVMVLDILGYLERVYFGKTKKYIDYISLKEMDIVRL